MISDSGYWMDDHLENHCYDEPLARELLEFFHANDTRSVVDLGCGHGLYTRFFTENGIIAKGYDGNPNTGMLTGGQCETLDLSQPVKLDDPFDWVLSLEVGEHIPEAFESTFIDNLHAHNTRGIIVSWAIPGQGGHGHFNERPNDYIKAIFEELGYTNDIEAETKLRRESSYYWFKNTIMVFRR